MKPLHAARSPFVSLSFAVSFTLVAPREARAYEAEPAGGLVERYSPPEGDRSATPAPPRAWEDSDHVRVGALLGLGFPRPFSIEALVKLERVVSLGAEYGMMPTVKLGPVQGSFWGVAADARVFPFRGAFFLGLRGGYQRMNATATLDLDVLGPLVESATAEVWFVNPRAGFLWTFRPGLTVGLDVGVQLPVKTSLASTLPSGLPSDVGSSIQGVASTFGHGVVPTIDLLRIGFLL